MTIKIQGDKITFPDDSEQTTAYDGSSDGIPEAPIDGKQYGRQDAEWTEVTGGDETSPVTFRSGSINAGQTPPVGEDFKIAFGTPATSEGGTFDGTYFTPNTAGWYQVSGSVFINAPTSSRVGCLIQKNGDSQLGSFNQGITAVGGGSASSSGLVYCNGTTDKLSLAIACSDTVGALGGTPNTIWFSAILSTGGSSSGGGGGSYTPEKFVWNDETDTRLTGTTYTNTNDVPLYVAISSGSGGDGTSTGFYTFYLDGVAFSGGVGGDTTVYDNSLYIVPAGSTYMVDITRTGIIYHWQEAKMPVAIGTGGGSYTPEAMVWKDKTSDRATGGLYTNTNDVPLDVIVGLQHPSPTSQSTIKIDGVIFGYIGMQSGASGTIFPTTTSFTVPSGSTYQISDISGTNSTIQTWFEAKVPVAVGTGGKTVAFRGNLSAEQTVTTGTYAKVNLTTTSIDTDSALVDGTFKPSVAGYYQVNGSVHQNCSPDSTNTISAIYKNGVMESKGSAVLSDTAYLSNVSDVIYLNGTTDYLELYASVTSTGTCTIASYSANTFLSAVLVSGGSGDSIWTEEGDTASHDGVVKLTRNSNIMYINPDLSDTGETSTIESQNLPLTFTVGGNEAMTIAKNGDIDVTGATTLNDNLTINTGELLIPNMQTTDQPANVPNCYIGSTGQLVKQLSPTLYSIKEIDDKLATKDKVIEALTARLDKLEKKVK